MKKPKYGDVVYIEKGSDSEKWFTKLGPFVVRERPPYHRGTIGYPFLYEMNGNEAPVNASYINHALWEDLRVDKFLTAARKAVKDGEQGE